ncbi:MAG TPA: carboxypeptidase regulatory-like domain-containing protein [Thermoanaerobaculia bacterium]|nr:carboxypeptidase regulatory-like domain-containing protein [Thermoanaerobaculia bacterium]
MLEVSAEGFATSRIFPLEIFEDRETTLRRPIELNRPVPVAIHVNPPVEPTGSRWRATVHFGNSFGAAFDPGPVFEGAVAESGVIEMAGQSPGRFRIRVADAAGNRIAEEQFEVATAGSPPLTIDIPVVRVRGTTLDGSSPLPATLWFGGEQGMPRVRMTSDESGEFSGWLPRTGRWVVDVRSTDGRISTATKVSVAESDIVEIVIPKTRVSGTVTDVKGPAANARVVMGGGGVLLRTVTDDKGLFSFTGVSPGSYTVTASSREGEVSAPVAVQLQHDDSATEHLRLTLKSPGLIAGRVLGKGRPLVGARVEVAASGGGLGTVTDLDGSFSVKVAAHADRASFIVRAAGHALTVFERPLDNDEVVLEIDDVAGTLEFPLGDDVTGLRLFQNGTFLPIPLALGWAQSQGVVIRQHALVAVPNVATGAYRLCHRAKDATERCADGTLLPGATLRLSVTR